MLRALIQNESGTETVEWAIMAGLLFVGIIAAIVAIGGWVNGAIGGLQSELGA